MSVDYTTITPFIPSVAATPTPAPTTQASQAPAQNDGNTVVAQQLMALMAALLTTVQSPTAPNLANVQSAAKVVISNLPQGQNPQWLTTVNDLAQNPTASPSQIQSAASTLQASLLNILPQTDPHAAGNQHHHHKGRHRSSMV
jgi:hypothetical protein